MRRTIAQVLRAAEVLRAAGFSPEEVRKALVVLPNQAHLVNAESAPKKDPRRERMTALYKEGKTLAEIGIEFGVSRERVRQIVALNRLHGGKTVHAEERAQLRKQGKLDARDAKARVNFGCDYETAVRLNDGIRPSPHISGSKASGYLQQKRAMQGVYQNVPYTLTFAEWLEAWGDKISFKGRGKLGLCRIDPNKGFEAGNVEIREIRAKAADTVRRTHSRMAQIKSLREAGLNIEQIAKELGIKPAYLQHLRMFERRFSS